MINFIQLPPISYIPNFSPECLIVESYLRIAKIPHRKTEAVREFPSLITQNITVHGLVPILKFLKKEFSTNLFNSLTQDQINRCYALQEKVYEDLLPSIEYYRYVQENGPRKVQRIIKESNSLLSVIDQKYMLEKKENYFKKYGDVSSTKILTQAFRVLSSLNKFLGDQKFFSGDSPGHLDIWVFAALSNIFFVPLETPLKEALKSFGPLIHFLVRFEEKVFPDQGL